MKQVVLVVLFGGLNNNYGAGRVNVELLFAGNCCLFCMIVV